MTMTSIDLEIATIIEAVTVTVQITTEKIERGALPLTTVLDIMTVTPLIKDKTPLRMKLIILVGACTSFIKTKEEEAA